MAKISTLTETFPVIDTGTWTAAGTAGFSATVVNGAARLAYGTLANDSCRLVSVTKFDLTDSEIFVKIADPGPRQTGWRALLIVNATGVSGNRIHAYVSDDNGVNFQVSNAFTSVFNDGIGTYDPATHVWLRIKEAAGEISFNTSVDGANWVNPFSTPTSGATWSLTDVEVRLETVRTSAQATGGYSAFDRINMPDTVASSSFFPFFTLYSGHSGDQIGSLLPPPSAPTCISAVAGAVTNSVVLNWNDSTFATGTIDRHYDVHEDLFAPDHIVETVTDSDRTSPAISPGTYRYFVVAGDSNGDSPQSPKVTVDVPVSTAVDSPPGCAGGSLPTAPIFVGDFSTGNFLQWPWIATTLWNDPPNGYNRTTVGYPTTGQYPAQIITDATKGPVARIELRAADRVGATNSSQVTATVPQSGDGNDGDNRWYQMSFRFDSTFPQNHPSQGWGLVVQWHEGENLGASPSVGWYVDQRAGHVSLNIHRSDINGNPISEGSIYDAPLGTVWHNYKMQINWSRSDTLGYIRLWKDNVRQNFLNGTQTYFTRTLHPFSNSVYAKVGYYRSANVTSTGIVYHSGFRVAALESGML